MFTRFYPLTDESKNILSLFPEGTFFFPSHVDAKNSMSGAGFIVDWKSSQEFALYECDFFDFIKFAKQNTFIFISRNMNFLEPVRILPLEPFFLNGDSIIFFGNYPFSGERWKADYVKNCAYQEYVSNFTKNLSPMKVMIGESSKMTEKQKMFLRMAVDRGFPYISMPEILKRQDMLQKWEKSVKISTKSKGSLHRIAGRSFSAFVAENKIAIEIISENLTDPYNFGPPPTYPITDCFSYLAKYLEEDGTILFGKRIPEICVNRIDCRAIFSIDKSETKELLGECNRSFNEMDLDFSVNLFLKGKYGKEKTKERFIFDIFCDFSTKPLKIYDIYSNLIFIENLIMEKLKELDLESYMNFEKKKTKEFWIKSVEVIIEVPTRLLEEIEALTKDYFSGSIAFKKGRIFSNMKNKGSGWIKTHFKLFFGQFDDFIIQKRKSGLFYDIDAKDTLTRIGIEHALRKNYKDALEALRNANSAMEADLLIIDFSEANAEQKKKLWKKANAKYRIAGIDTKYFDGQPLYLEDKHLSEIRDNLQRNYDWIVGLQLFLIARDHVKEALSLKYVDKDGYDRKLSGAKKILRLAGIHLYKDVITLEEGLSIYYARILGLMQDKGLDLAEEWLGLAP